MIFLSVRAAILIPIELDLTILSQHVISSGSLCRFNETSRFFRRLRGAGVLFDRSGKSVFMAHRALYDSAVCKWHAHAMHVVELRIRVSHHSRRWQLCNILFAMGPNKSNEFVHIPDGGVVCANLYARRTPSSLLDPKERERAARLLRWTSRYFEIPRTGYACWKIDGRATMHRTSRRFRAIEFSSGYPFVLETKTRSARLVVWGERSRRVDFFNAFLRKKGFYAALQLWGIFRNHANNHAIQAVYLCWIYREKKWSYFLLVSGVTCTFHKTNAIDIIKVRID